MYFFGLNSRKIVSWADLQYYLRKGSEVWCVDTPWRSVSVLAVCYSIREPPIQQGQGNICILWLQKIYFWPFKLWWKKCTCIFANSLDQDQAWQNVRPDLDPNCLTFWWYSWTNFSRKLMLKNQQHEKFPSRRRLYNQLVEHCSIHALKSFNLKREL